MVDYIRIGRFTVLTATICALTFRSLAGEITIMITPEATITEKFAAEELQKYLGKITGREFDIEDSKSHARFIIVVQNNASRQIRELNLGREEYAIKSVKNGLVLSGGGDRGTLYAVYDFLEKLGCRWYYCDEIDEILPALSVEEVLEVSGSLDVVERPDFSIRMRRFLTYDITGPGTPLGDNIMANLPAVVDWMCKNRINMFQYGLDHGMVCYDHWPSYQKVFGELQKRDMVIAAGGHSYFLFLPDSVFSEHREWWPEIDGERRKAGQFCTSNREAVDYYIDNIIKFLKENPQVKYLTAWPADTHGWCQCKLCADKTVADRYMKLGKETIERVEKEMPDVTFAHFAYGSHLEPPENEFPVPGSTISVCTWGRDFSQTFPQMSATHTYHGNHFNNTFNAWRKICDDHQCNMILHEKYIRLLGLGFQPLPLGMLQGDIQYFKEQRLDGFELPMGFMGRRTKALNFYTVCKLIWDTETDVNSIVNDYFDKCYDGVGTIMRNAYEHVKAAQPDLKYLEQINKLHQDYVTLEERYSQERLEYAVNALKHFSQARDYCKQALAGVEDDRIAGRIERFEKSLYYVDLEYKGLLEMTKTISHLDKIKNAAGDVNYEKELEMAQQCLDKVKMISAERKALREENPGNGLYWDITWKGSYCVFVDPDIERIQKKIDEKREQLR